MANWATISLVAFGPDAARVLVVNDRLVKPDGVGDDDKVLYSKNEYDEWGGEKRKDWLLTKGFVVKAEPLRWFGPGTNPCPEANIVMRGECKWGPPAYLVNELSAEFSDLTFLVSYSVDMLWDSAIYLVHQSDWELVVRHCGWFHTMLPPYPKPVHHYVSGFETDPTSLLKIKTLAEAKIIFHTETTDYYRDGWAFRCDPSMLGVVLHGSLLAYTLDEECYLNSVHNRAEEGERIGFALCRCGIELTQEEQDWIETQAMARPQHESDGESILDYEALTAYVTKRRHRLQIFTTLSDLAVLLRKPGMAPARLVEIEAAMKTPEWTEVWPDWTERMAARPTAANGAADAGLTEIRFLDELTR